ncbi:MAG: response regulator, partial [Candidatus Competibacteraceae bacterium]|nr:response regulator [Candidatus Competibacteraceae bacterium]
MGETLPGQDATQPVILMVDDTPANLGVLFELLSDSGFRVLVAEDGPSALTRAAYVKPDLILLDIMMPGMDGFEVCARLKQQAETAAIPVIFMTALSDTEDKVRGFELGAVDYIAKPFQDSEVLARVRTHLALQNLQRQLVASEERLSRIIASALDAIISVDQNGRITLFNPAAERVFQTTLDQVLRQPVQCLFDEELGKFFANYCQQAAPPITLPDGVHALRLDGGTFPIEGSLSSAELNGQPVYIFILRDLSEQTRNEAERRKLESLTLYLSEEIRAAHEIDDI